MMWRQLLVLFFLLSFFLLLTVGSFFQGEVKSLPQRCPGAPSRDCPARRVETLGRFAFRGKCTSGCCRRAAENCESHSSLKGSEGGTCHTETFLGLYNKCPCQQGLTCIFPKNEKSFKIIYGHCKKIEKKKPAKKTFF
ncbi:colipase-like protein 1 [Balaenoptera musculus]|uniref:Colipase-like protein 1 n=1 Tax=Balaenoptera musculus TaxID=9771 RepID=A0A8B8YU58_BALMU|nr:colipase-like protein 1 [Balaenoptera musculus]